MPGKYNRKDSGYRMAKESGYRSRAGLKLVELDKRFRILHKGSRVLDLGCAPGSWLQVAAEKIGPTGLLVGIDLQRVEPLTGSGKPLPETHILCGDIYSERMQTELTSFASGTYQVILSDMSPKLTGIGFRDAADSLELVERSFSLAEQILTKGGSFVAKVFPSPECDEFAKTLQGRFNKLSRCRLKSTRSTSTELYLVGINFNGR